MNLILIYIMLFIKHNYIKLNNINIYIATCLHIITDCYTDPLGSESFFYGMQIWHSNRIPTVVTSK